MILLSVQSIRKRYGETLAVDGIDLDVPAGSRTAIVGPSGSGKSTLLRLIAGFEAANAGRIMLNGRVLADGAWAVPAHRRGIGYVAQDGALFPHLSIADNIGFGLEKHMPERDGRILELMDIVELDRRMSKRRPHELSGGQQQRVALARALARQPKLLLLDEPFSALDTGLRDSMRKVVARILQDAGITAILVTHDQAEALSFADQVAVLRNGRLVQVGPPRDLYLKPKDRGTATFLGDAIILAADLGEGSAQCLLGTIAVPVSSRRGPAEIMLRPEQIRLTSVAPDCPPGEINPGKCYGRVTSIEFGGAACTIAVSIPKDRNGSAEDGSGTNASLAVKSSSIDLPPVGACVEIIVAGQGHVFDQTEL